ncbi:MAG: hypothetical protein IJ506_03815 [Clostridia bacterium]|nr:hypothetical protein [Clostridia bacterium]
MKRYKKSIVTFAFAAALISGSLGFATLEQAQADVPTETTTAFEMLQGASIRLAEPTGLRFQVKIGQQEYKTITEREDVELGMLILPAPYVTAYETAAATTENLTYHDYFTSQSYTVWDQPIADANVFEKADLPVSQQKYYEDNYYYASGVISNVKYNNYNRNFVGVAYQKTTSADGLTVTYDYATKSPERSIAYVASASYEEGDYDDDESIIEDFIEDSVYNLAGVTYDATNEQYTYDQNSYATKALAYEAAGAITTSVSADSDVMLTGKTQTATATIKVGETEITPLVKYGVVDATVATVNEENGLVTAQNINGSTTVKASFFGGKYTAESAAVTVSDGNIFTKAEGWRSGSAVGLALTAERAQLYADGGGDQKYNDGGYFFNKAQQVEYEDESGTTQTKTVTYWNDDEEAFVFYKLDKWATGSSGSVSYFLTDSTDPAAPNVIASPALRAILAAETKYVKFDVKVDETFMSLKLEETSNSGTTPSQMQIRMGWSSNNRYTTDVGEATAMEQCMFMAGEYVTVAVDISAMLDAYKAGTVKYVWFLFGGNTTSEICLKNFAPITENEYYEINNPFSYLGGGKASLLPTVDLGSVKLSQAWNVEEGAFTVTLKKGYFDRADGTDCARFNIDNFDNVNLPFVSNFIKRLSDSRVDGKAYIKFDVKVDETYVNTTAPNGKKFSFWVRSDSLKASTGQVLNDVGVEASATNLKADTWTTLYVDASKFLELYDISDLDYFQFTMYGPAGAKVSFKNMQVATAAEYEAASGANS